MTGHPREDLGAYLLAALPPADEAAVTAHLAACDDCARAVLSLADAMPALRRLDPRVMLQAGSPEAAPLAAAPPDAASAAVAPTAASAAAVPPAADGIASARRPARPHPSRRVRWGLALAAGAAAAVAVAIPLTQRDGGAPAAGPSAGWGGGATSSATLQPISGSQSRTFAYTGSDTVTVTYAATANGSAVNVRCRSGSDWTQQPGDASRVYELWIVREDGEAVLVRSWPPIHGDATFPGWVDFAPEQIKTFQLRDGNGRVLSESDA